MANPWEEIKLDDYEKTHELGFCKTIAGYEFHNERSV